MEYHGNQTGYDNAKFTLVSVSRLMKSILIIFFLCLCSLCYLVGRGNDNWKIAEQELSEDGTGHTTFLKNAMGVNALYSTATGDENVVLGYNIFPSDSLLK